MIINLQGKQSNEISIKLTMLRKKSFRVSFFFLSFTERMRDLTWRELCFFSSTLKSNRVTKGQILHISIPFQERICS